MKNIIRFSAVLCCLFSFTILMSFMRHNDKVAQNDGAAHNDGVTRSNPVIVPKEVHDFSLLNVDGKQVSLSNYSEAKGFIIIFTCNHCPFAKLYPKRMNDMVKKYQKQGVPLIAISSTDTITYEEDTYPNMVQKAKKEKFKFPYLYDNTQTVAKDFKADKTPHAYVIWKEDNKWVVKYNGAIDDNGMEAKKVKNQYLVNAVDALLSKKEVVVKETKSIGCQIHFRK